MDIVDVLSFDPDKVKFLRTDSLVTHVEKRTSLQEFKQISEAHRFLADHPILLFRSISFLTAPVFGWHEDRSILITKYCKGVNVEHALKNARGEERKEWILLFRELFCQLYSSGFLWGDCAPRNMIFDGSVKTVWIVDFERKIILRNDLIDLAFFSRYLRNYALEEFSCFLFREEQESLFANFLVKEPEMNISTEEISSRRKRKLLELTFGRKEHYCIVEIQRIEKLMAFVATPFYIDSNPFFPMEIIDKASSKGGVDKYANIVRKIEKLNEADRFIQLKKIAANFK